MTVDIRNAYISNQKINRKFKIQLYCTHLWFLSM